MPVYIVAAVQALIYLSAVPLCVGFCLVTEGGLRFGVGVSAFERRFALRRARRGARALAGRGRQGRGGLRRVRGLLEHMRVDALSLSGRVCLGDAAATAMACGALQALAAALAGRVGRLELDIAPDFNSDALRAELWGMIRVRSGQIMIAAARGGMKRIWGGLPDGQTPD